MQRRFLRSFQVSLSSLRLHNKVSKGSVWKCHHYNYNTTAFTANANTLKQGGTTTASLGEPFLDKVQFNLSDKHLVITWNNGETCRYPKIYLRDNCKCAACVDPSSLQKNLDFVLDGLRRITLAEATVSPDGRTMDCVWSDGHASVYPSQWLHERRLPDHVPAGGERAEVVHRDVVCWDHESLQGKIPRHQFEAVVNDDKSLFDCLYSLYQYGVMVVENGPASVEACDEFTRRLGHVRVTHYGPQFDVLTKKDPSNLAYTPNRLPFHTDSPYLINAPDIQLLHCVREADTDAEGTSLFVDAFDVARQLAERKPDCFRTLCDTHVAFCDFGSDVFGEYVCETLRPIIRLNVHGRVEEVCQSDAVRDDYFHKMSAEDVAHFYEVYAEWYHMLNDPRQVASHRLRPGDMAVFFNNRVLHSRTAVAADTTRYLRGVYYDRSIVFSKLKVLHQKLGLETPRMPRNSSSFF